MEIWMRLGVTADVTKKQAEILLGSAPSSDKQRVLWELVGSGAVHLEGETYIPQAEVEEFNEEHGTAYEAEDKDILAY